MSARQLPDIFDRMLGTNMDVPGVVGEYPDQRPFDFSAIFDDMRSFPSLGVSSYGGRLAFHSVNTSEIILTPSIEYITIDDFGSRMFVKGLFGDDNSNNGIVTVGNIAVPVTLWSKNLIICELPTVGPGSVGNVVVSMRGARSNVVPLTEWIIPLDLEKEELGIKLDVHLKLRIRADVHPYRSKPGEGPKKERLDDIGVGYPFAIGSTGNFVFGGQRQASCQLDKCQITESESAVSRNGVLPYAIGPGLGFGAYYKWSADMKTLYVGLLVKVPDVGYEFSSRMQMSRAT